MAGAVAPGPASPSELVGPVLPGGPGVLPGGHGVLPGGPGVLPGGGAYRGVATPVTVPPPPPSYAVMVVTQLKIPNHDHVPPFKSFFVYKTRTFSFLSDFHF